MAKKTWRVRGVVTVSAYTIVKAETEAEALEIAAERSVALAPNGPARDGVDDREEFIVAEADGSACDVRIDELLGEADEDEGEDEDGDDDASDEAHNAVYTSRE